MVVDYGDTPSKLFHTPYLQTLLFSKEKYMSLDLDSKITHGYLRIKATNPPDFLNFGTVPWDKLFPPNLAFLFNLDP